MKIFGFPRDNITYNALLYEAMERQGGEVVTGVFSLRWIWRHVHRGDAAHFHWPSFEYRQAGRLATIFSFLRWVSILLVIRLRAVRIFWTAHNLLPHDRAPVPVVDVWARHVMIALATRIFVHGRHAGEKLLRRFPRAAPKLTHIPHGNWIGAYRVALGKDEIRRNLAIPETSFAYVFVGGCKPYKNLEGLVAAFRQIEGDVLLLIAGQFSDPTYQQRIESLVREDGRITLRAGWIEDDRIGEFITAADAVVVPYREALTSGVAVLAMSFGRPIVSIATGHMLDIVTERTGVLYDMGSSNALADAMHLVRTIDFDEDAILAHAASFTFDEAGRVTLAAMNE